MTDRGRLRKTISRWANSSDQESRHLRETHVHEGDLSISEARDREHVRLRGTLRTVTLRPRGGVPALEADLDDGSGTITVVWLGRRRIAGIEAGRSLRVEGRIGSQDGRRMIYNPRYELLP